MLFLVLVLVPILRRPEHEKISPLLIHYTGLRFRAVGWICLILLLGTGYYNLISRGIGFTELWNGSAFSGTSGLVLAHKLLLVLLILLFSIVHDFWIGPKATLLARDDPHSRESTSFRFMATWLGRINTLLALLVVALAVILTRGLPR